jgi:hypothetical protein
MAHKDKGKSEVRSANAKNINKFAISIKFVNENANKTDKKVK